MQYTSSKERAKVIRHALKNVQAERISVTKGTGTASSWVRTNIDIKPPTNCTCAEYRAIHTWGYCNNCRITMNAISKFVNELSTKALALAGMEHSTFTSDDGYNTESSEYNVQVNILN